MSRHGVLVGIGALVMGGLVVSSVVGAQIVATGVLESGSSRSSRCTAISEDGQWVVGTSRKNGWNWPFYWSASGGIKDMGNPSGGNCTVTGCATVGGSTLVACGNIGGVARKYQNGAWSILPGNADNVVQAYAISRNNATGETWIAGSTVGADSMINEKAWRYRWSNNTYIHFWGYYQDAYGIARNGWAVGKNNWGNGYPDPRYRHDRPIFIFDWTKPGDADGRYGWDQLKPFAGYGEDLPAEGRATAINGGATWACGFMTYNPNNLGVHHAFKWQVPSNPVVGATPNQNWPLPIDLGTLGVEDTTSEAYCISDNATLPVIGGLSRGSFRYSGDKAVYWCAEGANDLYVVLQGLGVDVSRWSRLLRVTGVAVTGQSQTGTILVGYGLYDDDNNAGDGGRGDGFCGHVALSAAGEAFDYSASAVNQRLRRGERLLHGDCGRPGHDQLSMAEEPGQPVERRAHLGRHHADADHQQHDQQRLGQLPLRGHQCLREHGVERGGACGGRACHPGEQSAHGARQ